MQRQGDNKEHTHTSAKAQKTFRLNFPFQVVRSAEEAASVLATSITPEQCIKVLCPIIQTADYPINLTAIKMQTKVIERVSKETLNVLLPEIMPGLIQVRKLGRINCNLFRNVNTLCHEFSEQNCLHCLSVSGRVFAHTCVSMVKYIQLKI